MTVAELRRDFRPLLPTDLRLTLGPIWRGGRDPTMLVRGRGATMEIWRATRTPEGPATQRLTGRGAEITVSAWGVGAEWLLQHAPALVGGLDHEDGFVSHHRVVEGLRRRLPGLRLPRTQAVFEALLPTVLEQKVTGREARISYGALTSHWGDPAPGPTPPGARALVLPPDPKVVADTPSHIFHGANVERKRSDAIRRAAGYAHRLEEATVDPSELQRRIQAIPGLGPWTAAEVAFAAVGDADAVSVGDYHLKNWVSWNLVGEPRGSDERMLELLEPYRPHRGRVARLITSGGMAAPAYGPRLTIQTRW